MLGRKKKKADTNSESVNVSSGKVNEQITVERKRSRIKGMSKQARMQLAKTTSDPEILKLLAEDIDEGVRETVASNKKCTGDILNRLRMDPVVRVSVAAVEAFRRNSSGLTQERQMQNRKMLEAINEDESIDAQLRAETEKMLQENTIPSNEQMRMDMSAGLAGFFQNNPEFTEYEIALREGILLGGMLDGAYDYAIDLNIANRTGMSVDDAVISRDYEYDLPEPEQELEDIEIEMPRKSGGYEIER